MIVIKQNTTINAPADKVWDVLALQYGKADAWASSINRSEGERQGDEGAAYIGRTCYTTQGDIRERVTVWDEANKTLAYEVAEGFPFFVKQGGNTWRIQAEGQQKTRVSMELQLKTSPIIGLLMSPMMKYQLGRVTREAVEDLKYYLEQGRPHPRKQKALLKQANAA